MYTFNEIIAAFLVTHLLARMCVQCVPVTVRCTPDIYAYSSNATRLKLNMKETIGERIHNVIILYWTILLLLLVLSLSHVCIAHVHFGRCNVPTLVHILIDTIIVVLSKDQSV